MSLRRLKGVSVTVPFYTFNVASPLTGKKSANSDHTHQWTVGIRGFHGDLTFMIKKVTFRLHETYADPVRVVEEPPFEVHETGWGEFEVMIRVHFQPAINEKAVQLYHHIRLHPYQDDPSGGPWPKDKPVTSFLYDELIFNEPSESCYRVMEENNVISSPGIPTRRYNGKDPTVAPFCVQMEQEELESIEKAQAEVNKEIIALRQRKAYLDQEKAKGN